MSNTETSSNKRLAINTIILYIKLIVTVFISFWISRVVLQALGASDFGLYNVVGGIVAMLNIFATSMIATSSRYLAVELGMGESGNPNKVYNTVFIIHAALALLLILLGETVGMYYVHHYLYVDPNKIDDAIFVLHMSLLTTAFAVISVPSNGLIVARERFLFTSMMETASSIFKLIFIFMLMYYGGNKLRLYAVILAIVQFVIPFSYQIYCQIRDKEVVRWNFNKNLSDYKEIIGFASWMFIGALACIARVQGAAMIINVFFGTVLNAAFGLASQVYNATGQFTTTLRQAAIPQIMKSQSFGETEKSLNIVYVISRYSFLLMLIPAIPIIAAINGILHVWLGTPPEYTNIFIVLMLFNGITANLGAGFDASIQATGKVKKNQIGYSIINLSLTPIIYILYKMGLPPYMNVIVMIVLTLTTLLFQCYIMKELTGFSYSKYAKVTLFPSILTLLAAFFPVYVMGLILDDSIISTCIKLFISLTWTIIAIFLFGLKIYEKQRLQNFIFSRILKRHNS